MVDSNEGLIDDDDGVKILGVCGGIGSGKSFACRMLVSDFNCMAHLDADKIAHGVYRPGSQAVKEVAAEFGIDVLQEGTEMIDRKKLGAIVFADKTAMSKLEKIVWPHAREDVVKEIEKIKAIYKEKDAEAEAKRPIIVVEAAVLLDGGWDDMMDGVWVVKTPNEVALKRLIETRGMSREDAQKRIDAQKSRRGIGNLNEEIQKRVVTAVLENTGSEEDLKTQLSKALNRKGSWK